VLKKTPSSSSNQHLLYQLSHQLNHLARLFPTGITVAEYITVMMLRIGEYSPPRRGGHGEILCHHEAHEGHEEFVLLILSNCVLFAIFVVKCVLPLVAASPR
jgi:hypothetical protein